MNLTVLFQLTFTFIYNTFIKKKFNFSKISGYQTDPNFYKIIKGFNSNTSTLTTYHYLVKFNALKHSTLAKEAFILVTVCFQLASWKQDFFSFFFFF